MEYAFKNIRAKKNPYQAFAIVFSSTFLLASNYSFMSVYIVSELGQPAWKLALYVTLVGAMTLLANQRFGKLIDAEFSVKKLLIICSTLYFLNGIVQAIFIDYTALLIIGAPLTAIAGGMLTMAYSLGKEFSLNNGVEITKVNAQLRIATSVGWMIGAPFAFTVYGTFSSATLFISCSAIAAILILFLFFKSNGYATKKQYKVGQESNYKDGLRSCFWACCSIFCLASANSMFMSAGPIYFIEVLELNSKMPGYAFAIKCGTEIIAIYLSIYLSRKIGKKMTMAISSIIGVIFFLLMPVVEQEWKVYALCLFEGFYYGLAAGISLTFIQEKMPNSTGASTAYYTNSLFIGGLVANLITGVVGTAYGFTEVIYTSAAMCSISIISLIIDTCNNFEKNSLYNSKKNTP